MAIQVVVCLYFHSPSGTYQGESDMHYPLEDFGIAPNIGDLIVDPGVPQGRDRTQPANRSVYEVKKRYFLPSDGKNPAFINLIVSERKGRKPEANILGP